IPTIFEFVRKIVVCNSSYIILQTNLSFVVVPTLKESICKFQISTFFRITGFLHRTYILNEVSL
ncbi:hypothetical protein, partial [Leptospira interrogans]|uniref:hypothetical protein n=1 Tax=Leptospira interrogans TaxID=173 RepID=UPI000C1F9AE2